MNALDLALVSWSEKLADGAIGSGWPERGAAAPADFPAASCRATETWEECAVFAGIR